MTKFKIIRNVTGSWPEWTAQLDDGKYLFIRLRHSEAWLGIGADPNDASDNRKPIEQKAIYAGVTDCVDALLFARDHGYHFVAPVK